MIPDLIDSKAIFVVSVHHTGTWFVLNFLKNHSLTGPVWEGWRLFGEPLPKRPIVHLHLAGKDLQSRDLFCATLDEVNKVSEFLPIISPVRDPIKSLISRQIRERDLTHEFIAEGFVNLPKLNAKFVPIDLKLDRLSLLNEVLDYCKLPTEPWVSDYARNWPISNSRGEYKMKRWYRNGDMGKILPMIPGEYKILKDNENVVIPFLKSLGYEALPWWGQKWK